MVIRDLSYRFCSNSSLLHEPSVYFSLRVLDRVTKKGRLQLSDTDDCELSGRACGKGCRGGQCRVTNTPSTITLHFCSLKCFVRKRRHPRSNCLLYMDIFPDGRALAADMPRNGSWKTSTLDATIMFQQAFTLRNTHTYIYSYIYSSAYHINPILWFLLYCFNSIVHIRHYR